MNFDYLELGINDEFTIPHLGKSKWNIQMGAFVNKKNLRVIEWKYFRGSCKVSTYMPVVLYRLPFQIALSHTTKLSLVAIE